MKHSFKQTFTDSAKTILYCGGTIRGMKMLFEKNGSEGQSVESYPVQHVLRSRQALL